MAEPNDQLRRARECVESPTAPDMGLSRPELAELVNAWVFENTGRVVELNGNYIGKLERGVIRWPGEDYRAGLRAVLGVESDRDLGFRRPRRSARATVASVLRKDFIRTTLGVTAGLAMRPLVELVTPAQPVPVPSTVGVTEINELRAVDRMYAAWDNTYGGGLVREAITAQLRYAAELLQARCPDRLRSDLFSAVGRLGQTAGFMAFDSYAHQDAERLFRFACACAEEAGNWNLRAAVLASLARQAFWLSDPDRGLTHTELAMVRSDRLSPTERAVLAAIRARALAMLGRVQETAESVGRADEEFANSDVSNAPVSVRYYDEAEHMGETGHALADLAAQGRFLSEASSRLSSAIINHGDDYARARTFCQVRLASLLMNVGDPHEAATLGIEATSSGEGLRSRRITSKLLELRQIASPHKGIPEVEELRQRIGTIGVEP